jgi:ATP adenylyltransferase
MESLNDAELIDLQKTTVTMIKVLKKCIKPEGFNVGMNLGKVAGAGIDKHMHIHVVPRWKSDTNFMAVISDTKIVSQSLGDLYKLIIKNLKK